MLPIQEAPWSLLKEHLHKCSFLKTIKQLLCIFSSSYITCFLSSSLFTQSLLNQEYLKSAPVPEL